MKKILKVLFIMIILTNLFSQFFTVNATDSEMDIWGTGQSWINEGLEQNDNKLIKFESVSKKNFQEIIDFLWGIGLLAAIITTVVLGIKMMTVPPGEKSRVKQALSPYIVGIIIIFGALSIWKLLINILDGSL